MEIEEQFEVTETPNHTYAVAQLPTADLVIQLKTNHDHSSGEESQNEHIYHYTVSREVITNASEVFAKMVDNDHPLRSLKRRKMTTEEFDFRIFLDLYDDNPTALWAVLSALHLVTDTVTPDLPELIGLVRLCDKYDCVKAVLPWLRSMMKSMSREARDVPGNEGWFYLCVKLGVANDFHTGEVLNDVLFNMEVGLEEGEEGNKHSVYKRVKLNASGEAKDVVDVIGVFFLNNVPFFFF